MISLARVVEYTDIFPEEAGNLPDVRQLISHINRKHFVTLLSNMMNRLSGKPFFDIDLIPDNADNVDYVRFFLSGLNEPFIYEVVRRYHLLEARCASDGYRGPLLATRPAAVLRLLRYGFSIPPCEDDFSPSMEIDFFKALLLVNQEVNQSKVSDVDNTQPTDLQMAEIVIGYSYSNEGCESEDYNDLFRRQITRFAEFYSFFHRQKPLKPIRERFRAYYRLKSIAYYLSPHTVASYITHGKSGLITMRKVNKLAKINRRIMRLSSLPYDAIIEFEKNADYSVFRAFPFIQIDKYNYAIISMPMVMEHIYESLYFQLKPYATLAGFKSANDFRRYFTTDFTQDWMLNRFMSRCLSQHQDVSLSENECKDIILKNKLKGVQPPDYYIREGNSIILFELKDTLASAKTKDLRNADEFFNDLHERFFENKKGDPKAIRQLSANIKAIQEGVSAFDNGCKHDMTIYPVLVVDSTYYTMRGIHTKLEYWMREYFNTVGIDGSFVKPLVLVDISTLRLYCSEFKQHGFAKIFENYYHDIEWQNTPNHETILNSLKSFSEFMAQQPVTDIITVFNQLMSEISRVYKKKR